MDSEKTAMGDMMRIESSIDLCNLSKKIIDVEMASIKDSGWGSKRNSIINSDAVKIKRNSLRLDVPGMLRKSFNGLSIMEMSNENSAN